MSCGVTTRFVGGGLERPWEREGVMHGAIEDLPDAEAIVVLGLSFLEAEWGRMRRAMRLSWALAPTVFGKVRGCTMP